jgi:hypothetical protein
LIGTATIDHDDLLFARESLETANGPYDMRFFVQRGNDDADAHITLKANRLNFRNYHAQGAGASAVIAGSLGYVTFSSSRTLGRLSQRLRQNTSRVAPAKPAPA